MIGVRSASSFLMKLGDAVMGLSNSDGNVPDPGVCNDEAVLVLALLLSYPAAAIVAEDVAVAIVGCRRLRGLVVTEESNE